MYCVYSYASASVGFSLLLWEEFSSHHHQHHTIQFLIKTVIYYAIQFGTFWRWNDLWREKLQMSRFLALRNCQYSKDFSKDIRVFAWENVGLEKICMKVHRKRILFLISVFDRMLKLAARTQKALRFGKFNVLTTITAWIALLFT